MYLLSYEQIGSGVELAWKEKKNIYYCKHGIIVANEKEFNRYKSIYEEYDYADVYITISKEYDDYKEFVETNYELSKSIKDKFSVRRYKLEELEQARIYARENDMYICLYIVKGYIECRKLNREERLYIACDILFNSKGKVVYNDIERLDV